MSVNDIAADQLKCLRLLSVILTDGTLPMPPNWGIHTYPDFDFVSAPRLDGFFSKSSEPSVPVLRERLRPYVEKFGLELTEKPHGTAGLIGLHATGMWQGVELHMWGTARPEEASESEPAAEVVESPQPDGIDAGGHGENAAARAEIRRAHVARRRSEDQLADCVACSERNGVPILWPCLILSAVDVAEDFAAAAEPTPPADGAAEYTVAQLDWVACPVCGIEFGGDETTAQGAAVPDGRYLRAHPDCLPSTTAEPPGVAQ